MIIVRPVADLAKKMKVKLVQFEQNSTNLLGDWYAIDIVLNRKHYILCMSEKARLSLVLNAAPYVSFHQRLQENLKLLLNEIGIEPYKINAELEEMKKIKVAKTNNRSILGSMNEAKSQLCFMIKTGNLIRDPFSMSVWLLDVISLVLKHKTPRREILKLFE